MREEGSEAKQRDEGKTRGVKTKAFDHAKKKNVLYVRVLFNTRMNVAWQWRQSGGGKK